MMMNDFEKKFNLLAESINLKVKNFDLFKEALTHPSYANEHGGKHYERLEFLGDAILGFLVSEYLYKTQEAEEGEMSKTRAKYVLGKANSEYSKELGIDKLILLGCGAMENNEDKKAISDVFESFLGALYLDQGLDFVRGLLEKLIFNKIDLQKEIFFIDYKSQLQEYFQAESRKGVTYHEVEEVGPPHDKTFTISVAHEGIVLGTAKGKTKKEAQQKAAKIALEKLVR